MNYLRSAVGKMIVAIWLMPLCSTVTSSEITQYAVTYPYSNHASVAPSDIRYSYVPIGSIDEPSPNDSWTFGLTPREMLARIAPQYSSEPIENISTRSFHEGGYFIGVLSLHKKADGSTEQPMAGPDEILFVSDGKELRSSSLSPGLAGATKRLDISRFDGNGKGQFLITDQAFSWLYDFGSDMVTQIMSMNSDTERQVTAYALNSSGSFVGNAWKLNAEGQNVRHEFIYQDGVMKDLNELVKLSDGVKIDYVVDLSETGEIIAMHVINHNGQYSYRFMKLTPIVPEPASWLILAAGCGLLWLIRNRANARAAA